MMEKLHSLHIYRLIMNYVVVFQYGSALVRTMAICFKFLCQHEENYKLSSASISLDFSLPLQFPLISPCFYSILLNEIESLTSASHLCSPTGIPAFQFFFCELSSFEQWLIIVILFHINYMIDFTKLQQSIELVKQVITNAQCFAFSLIST